jgi:hypothetical protein
MTETYVLDVDKLTDDQKNELEKFYHKEIDNISDQEIINFYGESWNES